MGHGNAGGDVLGEKQLLHRRLVRGELGDELRHVLGDLVEAAGERDSRRRGDDPIADELLAPPVRVHHAKPDGGNAGVDA